MKGILIVLLSLCWIASGWRQKEIMIITAISRKILQEKDMFSYFYFEKIVKSINLLVDNSSQTYLQASCWPLDLQKKGLNIWKTWRASNQPILEPNAKNFSPIINMTQSYYNITRTLKETIKILNSTHKSKFKPRVETAMFSRYLLYLVAQIHFPLSCSTLYNETFPTGDQGGSKVDIFVSFNQESRKISLRKFWESDVVDFGENQVRQVGVQRPILQADLSNYYGQIADYYIKNYGKQAKQSLNILQPLLWAKQSLGISQNLVYPYFYETDRLDLNSKTGRQYVEKAKQIMNERITIAGFRLAQTISRIYRKGLKQSIHNRNKRSILKIDYI